MFNREQVTPIAIIVAAALMLVVIAVLIGQRRRGLKLSPPGPTAAASLYVLSGPLQSQRFELGANEMHIGRRPENQIAIDAPLVSRFHAIIQYVNGNWQIIDQDSTNGTWVNGRRVAQQVLNPDDRIQIGPSILVFQLAGRERTPTPQPIMPPAAPLPSISAVVRRVHDLSDYDLTELGRGGEGIVYRGVSRTDHSVVAIKILESQDPYLAQKFQQAGEVGTTVLRHPHIVATYHFGRQDDTYYIIMEYLEGGSLKDKIQYGVPYPPADAIRLLGQTCEALQFAHSHNVVHRDIKPSNILFDRAGMVKLSDFGIAKLMTAPTITQAGLILGTPEYMSYEQARGQPVVPQSDIYSLGVVAYQLFSGRLPFTNPDMWKILDQHLKDRPRPPRQFNPAIPSAIERAILKALEKDVSKRFRACEEFAQALGYTPSAQVAPVERGPERVQSSVVGAHLVVPETGQAIPISGSDFVIGRITLGGDPSVSRSHARIIVRGNQYWLRDENSTNGTFHNGQRIFDWVLLRPNDTIIFGRLTTRFVIGDNRPRAPARPGAGSKTRMMPG